MSEGPAPDCTFCPRLVAFREHNQSKYPDFHNAPVPSFGSLGAALLIVGLAPGLKGANRTARPFTGDYAGDLLYPTLTEFGFAEGIFGADPNDGLQLKNCRITNAVRCVPPENKPVGAEIKSCMPFLIEEIGAMPDLRAILALGGIAHNAVLTSFGRKQREFKFGHGARHALSADITLFDSYHCSRYNVNTKRLTEEMFLDALQLVREHAA